MADETTASTCAGCATPSAIAPVTDSAAAAQRPAPAAQVNRDANACRRDHPDVLFHEPGRRVLQDVVNCIRHGVTIDALGERRERHADRYLKPPAEMHRLFARYPEALARTLEIVRRCTFSMDELRYQYPEERDDPSLTPQQTLEKLTWEGAERRYPEGVPDNVSLAETRAGTDRQARLRARIS